MKFLMLMLFSFSAFAIEWNAVVPDFTLKSITGAEVKLSQYKGKVIVIESLNHSCPFVKKHYETQNMQDLQKKYTKAGVVWLSIISSAPGKEGYVTPAQGVADKAKHQSAATEILIDDAGKVGRMLGAKTTPNMIVISKDGKLKYQGAIDDKNSTDKATVKGARNYVAEALDAVLINQLAPVGAIPSYGCAIKY